MQNQFLKISVVTITLNRKEFLKKAIESVLAQNYPHFEHIIIDGGSTDGTVELLKSYPHLNWISEPDYGQADAMNKGIKKIKGDIFAWLNSDDTYVNNTFEKVNNFFSKNFSIGMIHGLTNFVNKNEEIIGTDNFKSFSILRLALGFNNINTPTIFIRKTILDKVGLLDKSLNATYDIDLYLRVAQISQIIALPFRFGNFCLHAGSGIVSEKKHLLEIPLLKKKYWIKRKFSEYIYYYFLSVKSWLYHQLKFKFFLKKI